MIKQPSPLIACLALAVVVTAAGYVQTQPTPTPLTKDEVIKLLTGNVPVKRVEVLVHERGIDFQVSPDVDAQLRQAGATDELLATLRGLAPTTAILMIESTPGGTHVYIDDEPVGTTSSEGRLKLSTLSPGPHRVRLSLDGYKDSSKDVALVAGGALELQVMLAPHEPSASAGTGTESGPSPSQKLSTSQPQGAQPIAYIFRKSNSPEGIADVYCDGVVLGHVDRGAYYTLTLSPGKHSLASTDRRSVEINAVSGGTYYVELLTSRSMDYGLAGLAKKKVRGTVAVVSKEIGESEVQKLKHR
jgi:PEGA domain